MSEQEKKALEDIKNIVTDLEDAEDGAIIALQQDEIDSLKIIAELIEQQQKEIEVLRKENFDTVYMQAIADYKSKIKEILEIEGNVDIGFYLKHLVAENNRLEDIEDDRDCNYVSKDKIREKIKELEQIQNTALTGTTIEIMDYKITILKQLLEE